MFFFQELVSDNVIGHTQPVFQFLCPLDKLLNEDEHYGGVWGLLSGLAYFLTPGQEEEEVKPISSKQMSLFLFFHFFGIYFLTTSSWLLTGLFFYLYFLLVYAIFFVFTSDAVVGN